MRRVAFKTAGLKIDIHLAGIVREMVAPRGLINLKLYHARRCQGHCLFLTGLQRPKTKSDGYNAQGNGSECLQLAERGCYSGSLISGDHCKCGV